MNVDAILRMPECFTAAVSPQELFNNLEEEVLYYKLGSPSAMPSVQKETERPTNSTEMLLLARSWKDEYVKWHTKISKLNQPCKLHPCLTGFKRVFIIVRKFVTDYHTESTLCALVSCKLNSNYTCFELETPRVLLDRARAATKEYNKAHSSGTSYSDKTICIISFCNAICISINIEVSIFLT